MIPVFYDPRQVVKGSMAGSPSAGKPADVVASWRAARFPIEIRGVRPASVAELARAHDPEFVAAVLAGKADNGFGNRRPDVAASLPWTSGSLLSAARHLVAGGGLVAVSPTSGFHHAHHDHAEGYCTFNGLMVTVAALRAEGFSRPIGLLDLDEHYADGTADILERIGERNVEHYTYGGEGLKDGARWLRQLPRVLAGFARCGLVLVQAGADPHRDDPTSRGLLDDAQLYERDRMVFRWLQSKRIPAVWNLAGGYQTPLRKVLDIHDNTMRACVEAYAAS